MSLDHEGIVKLYEYFETDDEFTMIMEYCNSSNYFENKIETKRSEVKNELKLRSFA
jgi:serine/threonine protein kinase